MQGNGPNLSYQLHAFRSAFLRRLPVDERVRIDPAYEAERAKMGERAIPRVGEAAPDFALPDQHGTIVRLADRLAHGPVVLLFVRGGWCPFCTLTLRAYQDCLPAIHESGGDLLAITPQPADTCCYMAERDLLAFQTLSDHDNQIARQYGIAYELDPALRPMYLRLGHNLPRLNATGNWTIPLPATFVIGQDGLVALAHVEAGAHQRLEPSEAAAALAAIATARKGGGEPITASPPHAVTIG
jgi:peroxiredoxin